MNLQDSVFNTIAQYPKALKELSRDELLLARNQGYDWLKELERLFQDAIDTVDRNHKRLGLVDESGEPQSPHYAKEINYYNQWYIGGVRSTKIIIKKIQDEINNHTTPTSTSPDTTAPSPSKERQS